VAAGAEQIVVMPVLLFAAGHAKRDIPAAVEAAIRRASAEHGRTVAWRPADVLESHAKLVELSARRYAEAVAAAQPATQDETCLILVGRGSHDAEAVAEMHRFAKLRCEATPVGRCEVAFIAMAEPKYPDVLLAAAQHGHRRIVVQPHLLFEGELVRKLRRDVADLAERYAASQWVVASQLGPDPLLADAIEALARAALR
ncbi:MAG: CbiX/SirB N-terminal domain-containing protein, partial [Pirellulales bacterium]